MCYIIPMCKAIKIHRPPHRFDERNLYFLTASTFQQKPFLSTDHKKAILTSIIAHKARQFSMSIIAYSIMDSHYHILFSTQNDRAIPRFIKSIHNRCSFILNRQEKKPGRQVWYSYWVTTIDKENDFWGHFNHIHQSPVNHDLAPEEQDYRFSSYGTWLERKGPQWMRDLFESFPSIDSAQGKEQSGPSLS